MLRFSIVGFERPNKITGANAGGARCLQVRALRAARIAQLCVSSVDYVMKRLVALAMAIMALAVACTKSDDPVVKVKAEDAEMNAAISAAQASITNFMAVFRNPQTNQQYFLVKRRFTAGDVVE